MAEVILSEPAIAGNPIPFAFETHSIRTIINGDGHPWFVAKDTAHALGIGWSGHTLDNISAGWRRMVKLTTPRIKNGKIITETKQNTTVINEPAVYKLAFRSNKPEADRFTNWIASEVIPALRQTGKYEICPATPEPSRLTTAKERNALTTLVNRYVGQLPGGPNQEAYKAAWRKVHEVMGIGSIEELTVEHLPRAVLFMKSLVDATALPEGEPQKALPVARRRNTLDDYKALYRDLPPSPQYWLDLLSRYLHAHEILSRELDAVKAEATKPFRVNRKSGVATYFDGAMSPAYSLFDNAEKALHLAYCQVFDAMEGFRSIWLLLHKG